VGGGLVGDDVGHHAQIQQPGIDLRGIAEQPKGERAALSGRLARLQQRVVEVARGSIQVALRDAALDAARVRLHADRHAAKHGDGEGLGPTHAAEPARQDDPALQRAVEPLRRRGGEGLVGALQDALRADVDPRSRRHLPVHSQAERLEAAELVPVGPVGDQHGVGDEHARRPRIGTEDANRLAGLNQERLVVSKAAQCGHNGLEALPVARRFSGAAVNDEVVGPLRHLRVEIVVQHAQRRFLGPSAAL
jgi:hypothetical protein